MSQYKFATSTHTIIVGWDDPLHTYFAQVWNGDPESEETTHNQEVDEPEPVLWTGTSSDEVPSLNALAASLATHGQIPSEILKGLRRDYVRSHGYDVEQLKDHEIDRIGTFLEGYWPSRDPQKDPELEPEF